MAKSALEEFGPETHFQRYIPESEPEGFAAPEDVQRHIVRSLYLVSFESSR